MSNRTRRSGLKLHHGRFRLDIRKKPFIKKVIKDWNVLRNRVVGLSSWDLEIFKRHNFHDSRSLINTLDVIQKRWTWGKYYTVPQHFSAKDTKAVHPQIAEKESKEHEDGMNSAA
ncbi:hypothetical protein WISP_125523 [Willisornis vidua]|uniref:Uncharacterized protein n=1 Tax=Willisornis vidua TaxID=1566151 RepID=A0ABQ9CR70_9PASS|nr:hypothetical protein WISP_125523 [Willisornis vidua]